MRYLTLLLAFVALRVAGKLVPAAKSHNHGIAYEGVFFEEVEAFLGIRYAEDTGSKNRFKPPIPFHPAPGSLIVANDPGPACPQSSESLPVPQPISEDCLRLNVWRPNGTTSGSKLPVLAYIYGGGFSSGTKDELYPGEMLLQSVANGHPIIHVELNYRLGVFGFAQNAALQAEHSENAGLRDQRLAIEWISQNIGIFGGDPEKITIHGQSSGGLAVGMQIMAYGGAKPAPFQQGICESQALEPRITGNLTRETMINTWSSTSCNKTSFDSAANIECLRGLSTKELLGAQLAATDESPSANIGDQWLPAVDGDFLPAAPSTLIYEHRFANISTMIGWCDDDALLFTPPTISTPKETYQFLHEYAPGLSAANLNKLLSLYPESDFAATSFPNGTLEYSAEFYRCGRILRDILFACQPILYAHELAATGNAVYFYDQNQTVGDNVILAAEGIDLTGPVHGSELIYVFGNLSLIPGATVTASDVKLRNEETRSWSSFTAVGQPSLPGHDTLPGWSPAEFNDENYGTYVIGGPNQGYSGSSGTVPKARSAMAQEQLSKRCSFLNSPTIVKELLY